MSRFFLVLFFVGTVAGCADRSVMVIKPAAKDIGTIVPMFVATNRGTDENQHFDNSRADEITYAISKVSVPPSHVAGNLATKARNPDPQEHFVFAGEDRFANKSAFQKELKTALGARPAYEREITLFVHGYNTSYSEAVFRFTQMYHDTNGTGVPVAFSWPSAASVVGYAYDHDSMVFSRDALQSTIETTAAAAPKRTLLVAHSMGAMLAMETLRQIEIKRPGWAKRNLSGVVLISPDVDIDVFRSQLNSIPNLPQPFVVFVSQADKVLELSAAINGRSERLGNESDIEKLSEYPILVIDITNFGDGTAGDHFTVGNSAELIEFLSSPELRETLVSQQLASGPVKASGQLVTSTLKQAEKAIQWILFPKPEDG